MATATLSDIKKKVRRVTRSLSTNILSEDDLNQYINGFIQFDFPELLRLFNLKTTFSFYTQPYKDVYETSTDTTNPLYDFKNKYISVHPPIYVAGYKALFSESREQFFNLYPMFNSIQSIGTNGDGITTSYSGTIPVMQSNASVNPMILLKNNVLFDSVDINYDPLTLIDEPISATVGNLYVPGTTKPVYGDAVDATNNINYITGQYVVTFNTAPLSGQAINVQTVPQQPSRPTSVLFYDGKFTVRPVPDQPYKIQMDVFRQPTELSNDSDDPDLKEWGDYIAFGAAKKIFEDRMDIESLQMVEPMFKEQEKLINRRTIVQQTSQRTSTIYTDSTSIDGYYGSGWSSGNGQY